MANPDLHLASSQGSASRSFLLRESSDSGSERIIILPQATSQILKATFEEIYLGPPKRVELIFPQNRLDEINQVFDQIILSHGIKDIQFDYLFS